MTMPISNLLASHSVDLATFEELYAGPAPWDIGRPQGQFVAIADRVTSPVLDPGCGTGEPALFLAGRGHRVIGIDFVDEAIRRARRIATSTKSMPTTRRPRAAKNRAFSPVPQPASRTGLTTRSATATKAACGLPMSQGAGPA